MRFLFMNGFKWVNCCRKFRQIAGDNYELYVVDYVWFVTSRRGKKFSS